MSTNGTTTGLWRGRRRKDVDREDEKQLCTRVDPELIRAVKMAAIEADMQMKHWIADALRERMAREDV